MSQPNLVTSFLYYYLVYLLPVVRLVITRERNSRVTLAKASLCVSIDLRVGSCLEWMPINGLLAILALGLSTNTIGVHGQELLLNSVALRIINTILDCTLLVRWVYIEAREEVHVAEATLIPR
jgi:hypothetical protein